MQTNNVAVVENFLLKTSIGEVFMQSIQPDVTILVGKMNCIGVQTLDVSTSKELPDLDDHWFVNLEVDADNQLQLAFSVVDHEAAVTLLSGLTQLLDCPGWLMRYGTMYRIYNSGVVTRDHTAPTTLQ